MKTKIMLPKGFCEMEAVRYVAFRYDTDVVRIEPAEKGLNYAANNYAIGGALISAIRNNPNDAASYPTIDPVNVNLADYDCISFQ